MSLNRSVYILIAVNLAILVLGIGLMFWSRDSEEPIYASSEKIVVVQKVEGVTIDKDRNSVENADLLIKLQCGEKCDSTFGLATDGSDTLFYIKTESMTRFQLDKDSSAIEKLCQIAKELPDLIFCDNLLGEEKDE